MSVTLRRVLLSALWAAILFAGIALPTYAVIDIVNSPNSGYGVYQRNSQNGTYTVKVFLDVKAAAHISALEANVTYNNTAFTNVSLSDQINSSSGAIWETSEANASYATSGSVTTVKYLKASTNGDYWSVAAGVAPLLYTLTFRVKNNAPTGNINILFDQNFAKVQDDVTGNITGTLRNSVYSIVLDSTAPTTSVSNGIVGGWYQAAQSVNLGTTELNNEATINYTVDGTDPMISGSVVRASGTVSGIPVPATSNGIRVTTLNYYAQDWAQNAPSNVETPYKSQVYYIDTEYPTINSVQYTPGPIGIGGTIYVTFNISDTSGLLYNTSYPLVNITSHGATKVTGNGMGQYVFSKVLASNDDNGTHYADISIQTRDRAGNTSTWTRTNAIALDFSGPTFSISATPNPAQFPCTVTVNVTASETLIATPDVFIAPNTSANYVSQSGLSYVYTFDVTGNGWTEIVPWLESGASSDTVSPSVTPISPLEGSLGVPITTSEIVLCVTDNVIVTTASLQLSIDGYRIISGGMQTDATTYDVSIAPSAGGYTVSVSPKVRFRYDQYVALQVCVSDWQNNSTTKDYAFTIEADTYAPEVVPVSPTAAATLVPTNSSVVFDVVDIGGMVTSSLYVSVNGVLAVSEGVAADPVQYVVSFMSVTDGVRVMIDPVSDLLPETEVTVQVLVNDNVGNKSDMSYTFKTEDVTAPLITPLFPTVNTTGVSANGTIVLSVTDFSIVVTGSVHVTVNGVQVMAAGEQVTPGQYAVFLVPTVSGYVLSVAPQKHLPYGRLVSVSVQAEDNALNLRSLLYQFTIENDTYAPVIVPMSPTADQVFVPTDAPLVIVLSDAETGIATASIYVTIDGKQIVSGSIVSAGYGVLALAASGDTSYIITITPNAKFSYWTSSTVDISVKDNALIQQNKSTLRYVFRTESDPSIIPQLSIKVYLQGYYDPVRDQQRAATINVQLRLSKFGAALRTYSVPLNSSGESGVVRFLGLPAENYYLAIYHELPGRVPGANHIPVLINDPLPFTGTFPVLLDLRTRPNLYYYAPYISAEASAYPGTTLDPFFTESNGKRSMRSGNASFDVHGAVNIVDFAVWRNEWQAYAGQGSIADLNADGVVDTLDFAIWNYNDQSMYPVDR